MIHKNRGLNPNGGLSLPFKKEISLETAATLIQTNLEHARHIESQRMFLALGYFAAMYALLPSALKDLIGSSPSRGGTAPIMESFLSSGIATLISFLCLLMTLKWNAAFRRWIRAAQITAETWAEAGEPIRSCSEPTLLFGFKEPGKKSKQKRE